MTVRHLLTVEDLSDDDVTSILASARSPVRTRTDRTRPVIGLAFESESVRTRLGFTVAASRLGGHPVEVPITRMTGTGVGERDADLLRVTTGMVDVLVSRRSTPIDRSLVEEHAVCPVINAGDAGPNAEHPTQALIDVHAITTLRGPIEELSIALCGDLRMRSARSLIRLLARGKKPRALCAVSTPTMAENGLDPLPLRTLDDLDDVDVLYVIGIPHQAVPESVRSRLRIDDGVLQRLGSEAIVLSPMPVIDEISLTARHDSRIKMFDQSDRSVLIRAAILERLLTDLDAP